MENSRVFILMALCMGMGIVLPIKALAVITALIAFIVIFLIVSLCTGKKPVYFKRINGSLISLCLGAIVLVPMWLTVLLCNLINTFRL